MQALSASSILKGLPFLFLIASLSIPAAAQSNLAPYQPPGWSAPIVVSNMLGSSKDSVELFSTDMLYIDWAISNVGSSATGARFSTELYVDNVLRKSWYTDPPFGANTYTYSVDHSIGSLSAGTHTIRISTDSTGTVSESNESGNQYTKTITVNSGVNLTPYQPPGWSNPIIISTTPGTTTDTTTLYPSNTLYLHWAVINNGTAPTAARFYTELYVDDVLFASWYSDPPVAPNSYVYVKDYSIGSLSAGTHTLRISTDSTNEVSESNESDNQHTKTITINVDGLGPNLRPNQPPGWPAPIVVSKIQGTNTDADSLQSSDTLYVDWSVINNGNESIGSGFTTELYVDGVLKNTWVHSSPLGSGGTTQAIDYSIGSLGIGIHTLMLKVDALSEIPETNETDNQYTKMNVIVGSVGVTAKVLVLLVDFSDEPGQVEPNYFNELMFGTRPPSAPQGSFRDFYREMSYGTFDVTGSINNGTIAWMRLPQSSEYYAGGCSGIGRGTNCPAYPQNAQRMVEDAVVAARNLGIDFGPFDMDNNGIVDSLFVVHSGRGGETSGEPNDIWSHAWVTRSPVATGSQNGVGQPVYVSGYSTEPEYRTAPNDLTMGVFAHEFGHIRFGLPDLYDTDLTSTGVGNWSLMSYGSWNGLPAGATPAHLDAWSKFVAGFLTPTKVTSTLTDEPIDQAATAADVYQVLNGNSYSGIGEYFLIENRQKTGFDIGLPGAGLLIWHIDQSQQGNSLESYPGCVNCSGNYKIALVQADNLFELERNRDYGDSGDPFPGFCGGSACNTSFTNTTNPSSKLWNGQNSNVSVTNISGSAARMVATIGSAGATATTTLLTSSANPSTFGESVTLSAAVSPMDATGTVTFKDGSVTLGTNTLDAGTATLTLATLTLGTHQLTAVYSGDLNYAASTSSPALAQVVRAPTTTQLTSSANPSTFSQSVTLTAGVSPASATGTITFKDGSMTLGTNTLNGGTATLTLATLTLGTHELTAVYSGNLNFASSSSPALPQVVRAPTTTQLTSSANPSTFGRSITLSAAVLPEGATGTVTFRDGSETLGTNTLNAGIATLALATLTPRMHQLTAVYSGDTNFSPSPPSETVLQRINQAATDLDGDGKTDIVWRHKQTGDVAVWLMDGSTLREARLILRIGDLGWQIAGVADLDGDGKADIVWHHKQTGDVAAWRMDGSTIQEGRLILSVTDFGWQIAGVADLDGDGKADIVWRHKQTGDVAAWLMDGATLRESRLIFSGADQAWQIAGLADLDGDGKADIAWRNIQTGDVAAWLMDGASLRESRIILAGADQTWQIAGLTDLDGDGKADIAWRNIQTGDVAAWLMDGSTPPESRLILTIADQGWQMTGEGDLDGDGKGDVVWRHRQTGDVAAWLMNGVTLREGNIILSVADQDWQIQ